MKQLGLIIMMFSALNLFAQNEPQKIVDNFFVLYGTKGPNEAIDYIFATNKWIEESKDKIENVKFQLNSSLKLLGKYEGFSLITKKKIDEIVVQYVFLVRYDRQPLRFTMVFYNPAKEWRLHNFSYDDSFLQELK